jgi:hypothetical protein
MTTIKLPKKVKVGHLDYTILFPYDFAFSDAKMCTGLHTPFNCTIKITDKFNNSTRCNLKVLETFIHEVLHAIDHVYINCVFSEEDITRLGNCFTEFLIDNDEFDLKQDYIPDELQLGAFVYKVEYPFADADFHDMTYLGDNSACIFYLQGEYSGCSIDINLIKEHLVFLVLNSFSNMYCVGNGEVSDDDLDQVLSMMARGIVQVFRDNDLCDMINKQRGVLYA